MSTHVVHVVPLPFNDPMRGLPKWLDQPQARIVPCEPFAIASDAQSNTPRYQVDHLFARLCYYCESTGLKDPVTDTPLFNEALREQFYAFAFRHSYIKR